MNRRMILEVFCVMLTTLVGCSKSKAPVSTFLNDPFYLDLLSRFDEECTKAPGEPKLLGKFAVIDANYKVVDQARPDGSPDQFARSMKELQTLVIIRSTSEQVGVFKTSQLPALRWTSKVIVVDVPKKQIVREELFLGFMPDTKRDLNSGAGTAEGLLPTDQIKAWLTALPRS
jgi:hypothetical protein